MVALFKSNGDRLAVTWQGYDFNAPLDSLETFYGAEQEGCFIDSLNISTPSNYQSEVQGSLIKQGGGIEYYNPRTASRVLNVNARVQASNLNKLNDHIQHIQKLFSPLYLQYKYGGWPPPAGRPVWSDPWETNFKGFGFTMLGDTYYDFGTDNLVTLEYAVAPLSLPDPLTSAIGTGWGARLDLAWMILDGGVAHADTVTTISGNDTNALSWGDVPMFPRIEFSMTGAGASNLTVTFTTSDPMLTSPVALVIDASGLSSGEDVAINVRDREVFVDGVMDNTILTTPAWPVISPDYTTTVAWTNTTNTSGRAVKYREALSA